MNHVLQVKASDSELKKIEESKLFIGMIAKETTESVITDIFKQFGEVESVTILKGANNVTKRCGFVKMANSSHAAAAIQALNGKKTLDGCSQPMVVKIAETEKEKNEKRMRAMPP
eukprot:Pgem_evm1s14203